MAKAPDLTWHAKKRNSGVYSQEWKCKYCNQSFVIGWSGNRSIRDHLRRMHKREYIRIPAALYFIEE